MTLQSRVWLAHASFLALAISVSTPALAQDAAPSATDESSDNAIVVTAQFREQNIQDTPLAITAVSGDTLEARGQVSLVDLGAYTPSVNLSTATSINANAVAAFIRGVGQEDSNFALEPGVGIYIDDVYFGTTYGASFDLVDLERVEILRGPQGTLAGKNSLGGAIKLYSEKPDDSQTEGYVEAQYGRFDSIVLKGSVNLPIAEGLATRLSANYRKDDGYFRELDFGCVNPGQGIEPTGRADDDCVLGRAGGADILTLRGALRYAPAGGRLEINISADYTDNHSQPVANKVQFANFPPVRSYVEGNPFAGVPFDTRFLTPDGSYTSYADYSAAGNFSTVFCDPTFGCFPYQVAPGTFTDPRQNSVEAWGVSGTIDYELTDDLSIKSITAYREVDGQSVIDIDGSPLNILKERLRQKNDQFTQELRLSGRVGDLVDFTLGGFYYEASGLLDYRINIPIFLYDFETEDPVDNRSIAAFAHVELHATDRLNFIGGLRYTDDKKTYTFSRLNADGTPISGIPLTPNFLVASLDGASGTFSGDRIDWRLGVNYEWADGIMTYAQVSTGYKGGGVNPRPFVVDQIVPFDPETLTTYEGGFKTSFLSNDVTLNGALFYNEYNDIQRTVYVCPTSASTACSVPYNAGDGHSIGAELELAVRPATGWLINGSLSLLDFEYDSINPLTGITLDMDAPFHNDVMASGSIQYEADLGSAGWLTPRIDVSYQSEFYYQAINSPYNLIPGRALANARLTYETPDRNWQVSASVSNLFDKYYFVGASENIANFGLSTSVVGRPREWSLSVTRRF